MLRDGVSKLLHILQHALGRDEYGRSKSRDPIARALTGEDYRNHFCVGPGGTDFDTCRSAVAQGLMIERPPSEISGGDNIFVVTAAGKAYVAANSPAPPKLSRSKQRYQEWLGSAAADCGVSFGDWLRSRRKAA